MPQRKRIPQSRRILEVKIVREVDTDPDTSYLGEYSNTSDSAYSIDRKHTLECAGVEANHRQGLDKLEHVLQFLQDWRQSPEVSANPDSTEWEPLDDAISTVEQLQADVQECDCGEHGPWLSREYQYFNPSSNYVDAKDNPRDGLTPEEVRDYVRQDFERMESYNNQGWCYLGLRAVVKVQTATGSPIQTLISGGLWGIESDSDSSYFQEVADEELSQLRHELKALGFSARAISSALKSVKEVE